MDMNIEITKEDKEEIEKRALLLKMSKAKDAISNCKRFQYILPYLESKRLITYDEKVFFYNKIENIKKEAEQESNEISKRIYQK